MKYAVLGVCLFTAACSGQPFSPTSPSGAPGLGAQTQAGAGPVEVTFTKWITDYPALAGIAGGDAPGTFAGTVLGLNPFDNSTIVQIEALYGVTADNPAHSFVARIEGKQNNMTQEAVLNGTVTSGWLVGARVHVSYDVIVPASGTSCVPAAPLDSPCFQGTIRILPGSAN